MDNPKVRIEVMNAVQRRASFRAAGMKSRATTPSSGKKVTTMRGFSKKSIVHPLYFRIR